MNLATAENEVIESDLEVLLESESDAEDESSANALTEAEREHYESIKGLAEEVNAATIKHESAKHRSKVAKESLEDLQAQLSTLINSGPRIPDPQKQLPFSELGSESAELDADPDAWKRVDIQIVLKLTDSQREKLEAAGITTVGRLEFVRAGQDSDFPRGLRSIKGFGDKTIDAIENDIVNWLAKNVRESEANATDSEE